MILFSGFQRCSLCKRRSCSRRQLSSVTRIGISCWLTWNVPGKIAGVKGGDEDERGRWQEKNNKAYQDRQLSEELLWSPRSPTTGLSIGIGGKRLAIDTFLLLYCLTIIFTEVSVDGSLCHSCRFWSAMFGPPPPAAALSSSHPPFDPTLPPSVLKNPLLIVKRILLMVREKASLSCLLYKWSLDSWGSPCKSCKSTLSGISGNLRNNRIAARKMTRKESSSCLIPSWRAVNE